MTTIQIRGVSLSAHAGANMPETFPAMPAKPGRASGDFARSHAGKVRRNDRRARIAAKHAFLNS